MLLVWLDYVREAKLVLAGPPRQKSKSAEVIIVGAPVL